MAEWEKSAADELAPLRGEALYVPFEPETPGIAEKGNVHFDEKSVVGRAATFDAMNHVEASAEVHTRLTFRFQGRDYRLTDVHGTVVKGILT